MCANVVSLSLLHVAFLSLQHVAATCPCNITPCVCPLLESVAFTANEKGSHLPLLVKAATYHSCRLWFAVFKASGGLFSRSSIIQFDGNHKGVPVGSPYPPKPRLPRLYLPLGNLLKYNTMKMSRSVYFPLA